MAGDIIALNDAGNRQPIRHAPRGRVLLEEIAGGAVAYDKDVQVEFRLVQGHEVDQPVNRIPAADKASEAENHARWQAEVRFGDLGIGDRCRSARD